MNKNHLTIFLISTIFSSFIGGRVVQRLCKKLLMKVTIALVFLLWLLMPPAYSAETGTGAYFMGGGVGGLSCPNFVETISRAKAHGIGSVNYAIETSGFLMYVLGFRTAYNLQTSDTYDIFDNFEDSQLLAWLDDYCKTNPLKKFSDAVVSLSQEAYSLRKKVGR